MIGFLLSYLISTIISILFIAALVVALIAASKNMWKTGTIDKDGIISEMKDMGKEIYEETKWRFPSDSKKSP